MPRINLRIDLPVPPSANGLYPTNRKTGKRFKSKEYAAWEKAASDWLLLQKRQWSGKEFRGPVKLSIRIPQSTRGDASNRIKAAEDLLVRYGLTSDDRHNHEVTVKKDPNLTHCVVTIEAAE